MYLYLQNSMAPKTSAPCRLTMERWMMRVASHGETWLALAQSINIPLVVPWTVMQNLSRLSRSHLKAER